PLGQEDPCGGLPLPGTVAGGELDRTARRRQYDGGARLGLIVDRDVVIAGLGDRCVVRRLRVAPQLDATCCGGFLVRQGGAGAEAGVDRGVPSELAIGHVVQIEPVGGDV